ncbi:MAG: hypothetical protein WD407_00530 [Rhodospirillales bacterium]
MVLKRQDQDYEVEEDYDRQEAEEPFAKVSIGNARWFVVCLVVVISLWIWPFGAADVFIEFGISVLKAAGWLIGIALIIFFGSITLAALGDALLKESSRARDEQSTPAKEQA